MVARLVIKHGNHKGTLSKNPKNNGGTEILQHYFMYDPHYNIDFQVEHCQKRQGQ